MNKGEHLWQIANGPTPKEIAEHPALKGLDIPPTGRATRPVTLVTKTLLFTAEGWGGSPVLRAHDKATGDVARRDPAAGRRRRPADDLHARRQAVSGSVDRGR